MSGDYKEGREKCEDCKRWFVNLVAHKQKHHSDQFKKEKGIPDLKDSDPEFANFFNAGSKAQIELADIKKKKELLDLKEKEIKTKKLEYELGETDIVTFTEFLIAMGETQNMVMESAWSDPDISLVKINEKNARPLSNAFYRVFGEALPAVVTLLMGIFAIFVLPFLQNIFKFGMPDVDFFNREESPVPDGVKIPDNTEKEKVES